MFPDDDATPDVPDTDGVIDDPAGEGHDPDTETEPTVDDEPKPKDEHGWRKSVDRLTRQRGEARDKLSKLETEHESLKQEVETLRGSVADETVIAAAETAGILPQFIDKTGANVLLQASKLERDLSFFESHIGGESETFELGDKTYTGRQAAQFAASIRGQLRSLSGKADSIKTKAADRIKSLIDLGMAADKAGWKPGSKVSAGKTASRSTPPNIPGENGDRRSTNRENSVPKIDWSKITTRAELMEARSSEGRNVRRA